MAESPDGTGRPEDLSGYTEQEVIGEHIRRLFMVEDIDAGVPEQNLGRAVADGRFEDVRWLLRKDGSRFCARSVTTLMLDDSGELRGFVKVFRDETATRASEQQKQRLQDRAQKLLRIQVRSKTEALKQSAQELSALTASLLTAQDDERRRIARELHDDLGQRAALLQIEMEQLLQDPPKDVSESSTRLEHVPSHVAALSDQLCHLSHRWHPAILEELGLLDALHALADEFQRAHTLVIQVRKRGFVGAVPLVLVTTLYRLAQEALCNGSSTASRA